MAKCPELQPCFHSGFIQPCHFLTPVSLGRWNNGKYCLRRIFLPPCVCIPRCWRQSEVFLEDQRLPVAWSVSESDFICMMSLHLSDSLLQLGSCTARCHTNKVCHHSLVCSTPINANLPTNHNRARGHLTFLASLWMHSHHPHPSATSSSAQALAFCSLQAQEQSGEGGAPVHPWFPVWPSLYRQGKDASPCSSSKTLLLVPPSKAML